MKNGKRLFLLGGHDEEMEEIKNVLISNGQEFIDKELSWGASAYADEIADAKETQLVFVELEIDLQVPVGSVIIDHHGSRAGEPPALIQVLNLLKIAPTRRQVLIGAFDAGYAYGLQAIGASNEEIAAFLNVAPDLAIKEMLLTVSAESGVTEDEISEAERAVDNAVSFGDMIIVECAHSKTSLITARLFDHQKEQNILILSRDGEVNYFGNGETVRAINDMFKSGWSGGAGLYPPSTEGKAFWEQFGGSAPDTAFWGGNPSAAEKTELISFLEDRFM